MIRKDVFSGQCYVFHISRAVAGNGSGMGCVRLLAGGFIGHSGSWYSCGKISSENQAVKKPRSVAEAGLLKSFVEKGF